MSNNPFLDLALLKQKEQDDSGIIPTDSDIDNVGTMDNIQQPPVLPTLQDQSSSNNISESLPSTTDIDVNQDMAPKKMSIEDILQDYRSSKKDMQKQIAEAAERDKKTQFLNNLSKAMSQLNTGLASGYANLKFEPIDLGPANEEAKVRAAQQQKLSDMLTEFKLQKELTTTPTEMDKIKLETAKETLKKLKEDRPPKEKVTKFQEEKEKNIANRYAELESQVPEKLSSINEAEFLLDKIERNELDTGFGQETLGTIGSVFQTKESSYKERLDALAEKAARAQLKAMGEIRPTDADVEGMKKALFNVSNTEETNISKLRQFIDQQKAGLNEYQQMKESLQTGKGLEKFISKETFLPQKEIKEDVVKLRSPDGSQTVFVKGSEVQKYLDKGATIVKD